MTNTNAIDPTRHQSHFSPAAFGNRRIDIIGAGATGSVIALMLAKLGVENLHVWDFDKVEEHNLANQMYSLKHVGMNKVDALKDVIQEATGLVIKTHNKRVEADTRINGEFVFLLVDSMEGRREIAHNCLRNNITTQHVIETRMGAQHGYCYAFNPMSPSEYEKWESTLSDDAVVETSACGTAITVGPTAMLIGATAMWMFMHRVKGEQGMPNYVMQSTYPFIMNAKAWK